MEGLMKIARPRYKSLHLVKVRKYDFGTVDLTISINSDR